MRRLAIVLVAVVLACGDVQPQSQALAPASATPTALPSGVIDPHIVQQRALGLTAYIVRADKVSTTLTSRAAVEAKSSIQTNPGSHPTPDTVWVVAVVGELKPSMGLIDLGPEECGLFGFDAYTGDGWMTSIGPLANCVPYFKDSLTPADQPVHCPAQPYDNGLTRQYPFTRTRPGVIPLTIVRDDGWHQPTSVPGTFLMSAPVGSVMYQDAFCLDAFVRAGPTQNRVLANAVGARAASLPALDWAVWLRNLHATHAETDGGGRIVVTIEPRAGFEWAFFDWSRLSLGASYVMFVFVDANGNEIRPWRLFNGP